jgi:hypothetical protein
MDRERPVSGMRAAALAVALFAITVNFLQPLAHAALLRDGAPVALWGAFCNAMAAGEPDGKSQAPPAAGQTHDCCLGLAHAPTFVEPPQLFVAFAPIATKVAPLRSIASLVPVGVRDGPVRPRGPPTFA